MTSASRSIGPWKRAFSPLDEPFPAVSGKVARIISRSSGIGRSTEARAESTHSRS